MSKSKSLPLSFFIGNATRTVDFFVISCNIVNTEVSDNVKQEYMSIQNYVRQMLTSVINAYSAVRVDLLCRASRLTEEIIGGILFAHKSKTVYSFSFIQHQIYV